MRAGMMDLAAEGARRTVEHQLLNDVLHVRASLKGALTDLESRVLRARASLMDGQPLYANGVGVIQGAALTVDLLAQRLETLTEQVNRMRIAAEYEAYAEEEVARG